MCSPFRETCVFWLGTWQKLKNTRVFTSCECQLRFELYCSCYLPLTLWDTYNSKFSKKWFSKVSKIVKHFQEYFFEILSFMVMCSFKFHEFSKIFFKIILASYFWKFNLRQFSAIRYTFCRFKFWWDSSRLSNNKFPM